MKFPFQKTISTVLIGGQISLMFTCISAYAKNTITPQEFGAQDAYILQKQTMNDLNNTHVVGKNIIFGNSKVQQSVNKNGPMITDDLTPTTAGKIPANKYYVNKKEPSTTNMQATYKLSDDGIDVLANQKKDNMDDDLKTDSATIESQAYSTIAKVAAQSKPINSNDPIFSKSDGVIGTTNGNPFADCELDKKIIATKKQYITQITKNVQMLLQQKMDVSYNMIFCQLLRLPLELLVAEMKVICTMTVKVIKKIA